MDALDRKALALLAANARITWADLGQALKLSAPSAAERVRKLEERGLITGYAAIIDAESAGYPLLAFILVTLENQRKRSLFIAAIKKLPEVLECHHIAGEDDYLLKVRAQGTKDLDRLLSVELKEKSGVARTRTTIVLGTAKETSKIPIA